MKAFTISLFMFLSFTAFAQDAATTSSASKNISGFKLLKIEHGSIYEQLGLKEGDVIKKFNDTPVTTADLAKSLFSKIKKADQIEIVLERNKKEEILRYTVK